jgi:hypothetical protein
MVLAVGGYWMISTNRNSTIEDNPFTHFGIKDTAAITRIFIADHDGGTALIERKPNSPQWIVNKKYRARQDAIDLIMMTLNRMRVRSNAPLKARDNFLRELAVSAKKVEVYQGGNEPVAIYYIGPATQDHTGTIALLELPDEGKSPDPYIVHLEGFTGFLTPRFFTSENDWRYTGVFEYPQLEFLSVSMIDHGQPDKSFKLELDAAKQVKLKDHYNASTRAFEHEESLYDTTQVRNYLIRLKRVHFETYLTELPPTAVDSIMRQQPAFTIDITGLDGKVSHVDLFWRKSDKYYYDASGKPTPWDMEYFWGRTDNTELALAQSYVFGPLLIPVDSLLPKKVLRRN